jgi:hypothetical protein
MELIFIENGTFQHLGTSSEVLNLLCEDSSGCTNLINTQVQWTSNSVCGIRFPCFSSIQSFIRLTNHSAINCDSDHRKLLIEFSVVSTDLSNLPQKGAISHIYPIVGKHFPEMNQFLVQQIFITPKDSSINNQFVLLMLHITDDVKATYKGNTVFGVAWETFIEVIYRYMSCCVCI